MGHNFIITVCKSTHLGVSGPQRVKKDQFENDFQACATIIFKTTFRKCHFDEI